MIQLRKATSADKQRIMEISSTIWDGEDYLSEVYDKWLEDENGEFTLAELDGNVIGCAKYQKLKNGEAWLEGIRGDKNYTGKGLGHKITEYYINKAKQDKIETIRLSTFIDNYESIHIIEKLGFKRDGYFTYGFKPINKLTKIQRVDSVINIMSTATAWHFISNSNFYMMSNGYISEGWKFHKLDYELLNMCVRESRVFGVLKEGKIIAITIITEDKTNKNQINIGYIDGTVEGIKKLLDFITYKGVKNNMKAISIMSTLDDRILDMLELYDYEFIAEKQREVNVFVYTYKL